MAKIPNEKKNVRRLCAIADVSAKCCCHSLKEKRKEAEDALLVEEIRELRQRRFFSLGYRKMAAFALGDAQAGDKREARQAPDEGAQPSLAGEVEEVQRGGLRHPQR